MGEIVCHAPPLLRVEPVGQTARLPGPGDPGATRNAHVCVWRYFRTIRARDGVLLALVAVGAAVYLWGASYAESVRRSAAAVLGPNAAALPGPAALEFKDRATSADRRAMRAFAAGRTGYVVWESRRPSGTPELKYRIWKRNLDGSGFAMVSGQPTRQSYAHMGPRISPDGSHVIFAGKDWNSSTAGPGDLASYGSAYAAPPFDAWIVDVNPDTLEPGVPRELLSVRGQLGSAGVNRFFEWKDDRTVYVYLPAMHGLFELDVFADRIGPRVAGGLREELLPTPDGDHAYCAAPGGVCVYDLRQTGPVRTLSAPRSLPGCQAVPSSLGDFLVWVRSPGRLAALDLAGPRTPPDGAAPGRDLQLGELIAAAYPGYDYCYFPALSRDRSLLTCAASRVPPGFPPDRSDLKRCPKSADFEIFLIRFDPATLRPAGTPVRWSYNDHAMYPYLLDSPDPESMLRRGHALDRFPDVWVRNKAFERQSQAARSAVSTANAAHPAARLIEQAAALETVEPRKALELYDRAAREGGGTATGAQAERRAAELAHDTDFQNELRALAVLDELRRAEAAIRPVSGPASFRTNAELAHANAGARDAIRTAYAVLLRDYPATRAMIEARDVIVRWDIDVPREVPANRRVLAEVEAAAVQVSTPLPLKAVYPYTQAFLTARFRVRNVLSGQLPDRDIVVVLMSMDDGKDLAAARLKPGALCRLRLGLWADQVHFHSHKMSDDVMDLDATLYFALDAAPLPPVSPN